MNNNARYNTRVNMEAATRLRTTPIKVERTKKFSLLIFSSLIAGSIALGSCAYNQPTSIINGYFFSECGITNVKKTNDGYEIRFNDGSIHQYTMDELNACLNPRADVGIYQKLPDGREARISVSRNKIPLALESLGSFVLGAGAVTYVAEYIQKQKNKRRKS